MFIVSDIFQLKSGHYKDVKVLLDEAFKKGMMPEARNTRVLSDFTGNSYLLIMEEGYDSLEDYEKALTNGMADAGPIAIGWKSWYEKFKQHVESSQREIVKVVM